MSDSVTRVPLGAELDTSAMSRVEKVRLLQRMRRQLQALYARLPSSGTEAEAFSSGPMTSAPRPQPSLPQPAALTCM